MVRKEKWCPKGKCGKKVVCIKKGEDGLGIYECSTCKRIYSKKELEELN